MLTPVRHRPPFDSPRWTEADARIVLEALARSGQSVREFAEEHGIDAQRLYLWRRRVAGGDRTTFRELVVRAVRPGTAEWEGSAFDVTLPSGVKVRVPASFDAEELRRLLAVLDRAVPC